VLESLEFSAADTALSLPVGILAVAVSAAAGYVFLRLLLRFVREGQFGYFTIYCLAVGIWAICWFPR
jgi:undecaprenyl pyrophosphate phosphatase UppP